MDLFLDLNTDQIYAFVSFLVRLRPDDYQRVSIDAQAMADAMAAGREMILAFHELGYITTDL